MRTTIELPDDIKQKLMMEAVSRNMKGYSRIIADALRDYFKTGHHKRKQLINSLKGCLSKKEYLSEVGRLEKGRANWRE